VHTVNELASPSSSGQWYPTYLGNYANAINSGSVITNNLQQAVLANDGANILPTIGMIQLDARADRPWTSMTSRTTTSSY
jgi:hypothetical protein